MTKKTKSSSNVSRTSTTWSRPRCGGLILHKCIVLKRNEKNCEQGSQSDCKFTGLISQSSYSHEDWIFNLNLHFEPKFTSSKF